MQYQSLGTIDPRIMSAIDQQKFTDLNPEASLIKNTTTIEKTNETLQNAPAKQNRIMLAIVAVSAIGMYYFINK